MHFYASTAFSVDKKRCPSNLFLVCRDSKNLWLINQDHGVDDPSNQRVRTYCDGG